MKNQSYMVFVIVFLAKISLSAQSLVSEIPAFFPYESLSFTSRGMDITCSVMQPLSGEMPCHGAFLGMKQKTNYWASANIGNNASTTDMVKRILSEESEERVIKEIFDENSNWQVLASSQVGYLQTHFAINWIPYQMRAHSLIKNAAYPVAALHAAEEQELQVQWGSYLEQDWYGGIQLRYVERDFVRDEVSLFEAISESSREFFPVQRQRVLLLEPSLLYELEREPWKPRFATVVRNLGVVDEKHQAYQQNPVIDSSLGVSPPVGLGRVDLALGTRWFSEKREWDWQTSIGYHYLSGQGFASYGQNLWSVGYRQHFANLVLGLQYWREDVEQRSLSESYFLQIGLDI